MRIRVLTTAWLSMFAVACRATARPPGTTDITRPNGIYRYSAIIGGNRISGTFSISDGLTQVVPDAGTCPERRQAVASPETQLPDTSCVPYSITVNLSNPFTSRW